MRRSLFSRSGARAGVASLASLAVVVGMLVAVAQPATAAEVETTAVNSTASSLDVEAGTAVSSDITKSADLSKFNAGNIISDAQFFDSGTMTEAQIQSFLEKKVSSCRSGYTCLKDWYDTSRTTTASAMCGAYSGGVRERASRIIYKVAKACGINPQVLLVMLEKEQGLVSHVWPSEFRYTIAMGQGCPDTAACDTQYYGFFNQVYGAARQMKIYTVYPNSFTYRAGQTNTIYWHPNASCGTSNVYIENQATANLYIYTPYRPNAAALNAGYGTGDGCSSYGNRNFYQYFTDWFGAPVVSDPCAQPAAVSSAKKAYVVSAGTLNARTAPSTLCSKNATALSSGTIVQAVGAVDGWLKIRWLDQDRWISRDYVRYATQDEKYCAVPGNVTSATKVYVVTEDFTGRIVPNSSCATDPQPLENGAILQATDVNSDRDWINLSLETGETWVARSSLRAASSGEAACAVATDVGNASLSYVVNAGGTTARSAPNSKCSINSTALTAGIVVTASAVSSDRKWVRVNVGGSYAWILRSDTTRASSSAVCSIPAEASSASKVYVLTETVVARAAPNSDCSISQTSLSAGTVVQAVGVVDGWLKVQLEGGDVWIPRSGTAYATSAQAACAVPGGVGSARQTYVVGEAGTTGRSAPNSGCASGAVDVSAGTIVTGVGVNSSRDWLKVEIDGRGVWLSRSDLTAATTTDLTCKEPSGYSAAKKAYVVQSGTVLGRTAPSFACGEGAVSLSAGTVVQAVGVVDGWLKVQLEGGDVWIPRSGTAYATSAQAACAVPGGVGSARQTYVVGEAGTTGRSAPNSGCASGAVDVSAGTIVTGVGVNSSRDWLKVEIDGRGVWLSRSDLTAATTTDLTCKEPSGYSAAKKAYVVQSGTVLGRTAPSFACGEGAVSLSAGTVVQAVGVVDGWLKVQLEGGDVWIPRSGTAYATSAQAACAVPGGVGSARQTYVVGEAGTTGRSAPNSGCASGAVDVSAGTIVTGVGVNSSRDWLKVEIDGRGVWLDRSDLTRKP
ncbi:hypothetical protein FHX49_001929 [Microbacterium endophyticum]|uniref:SH3b domain-containing protein n=2 Tax=Microbacterium endophyticum TaxID=1526412 RepID=A0A7W4V4X1_9MICO|nr:hypothetical protein [Microbacterium endophyticum]MBB2976355.1 hypothetical protein [Microbacterium endophyticum]